MNFMGRMTSKKMKIYEILDDWYLKDHEVSRAKDGYKCLFLLPESYKSAPTKIFHLSGMSFTVIDSFKKKFEDLTKQECLEYGVKTGYIPASCDHPDFYQPYYGTIISTQYNNAKDALLGYLQEFEPERLGKVHTFVKTYYTPLYQEYGKPTLDRSKPSSLYYNPY